MAAVPIAGAAQLKDAYRRVMDRVAAATERRGHGGRDVVVVAVTKNASPDQIRQLVEWGHIDLGENRVQQLVQRVAHVDEFLARHRVLGRARSKEATAMPRQVRWHMVGHVQRNKVSQLLPLVRLVHSVDSLRLAEELHAQTSRMDRVVDVLLQVNVSQEPTKFGVAAPAALHLAEQIDTMVHLRLRGLMTIGPLTSDARLTQLCFARTAEIFHDISDAGIGRAQFNILSMGMSDDFELALAHGANVLRIGRAIFGDPPAV